MWNNLRWIVCWVVVMLSVSGCGTDKAGDFLSEGRKLMGQGNPAGAVVLFKNALEKDPGDYTLHLELGRAYYALGKIDLAENELQKCYRQQPNDPALNLALGEVYVARNLPDQALVHVQKFEEHAGATAASRELAGLAYGQARRPEEARKALEQAFSLDPKCISARLALGRLFLYRGDLRAASSVLQEALSIGPDDSAALALQGDILLRQGETDKALSLFRRVTQLTPLDENARYMVGVLQLQLGNEAEAAQTAAAMRADFKDSALVFLLEGALAATRKDFSEAATLLQRSVALRPSVEGYYKLGMALYAKGDLEMALSQFNTVLASTPDHDAARRMVCTILLAQRRLDEAMQEARKLLDRNPGDANAHFLMAGVLLAGKDKRGAEKELEAGLAQEPAHIGALLQLSTLKQSEGRTDEALADLRTAVVAAPDNIIARNALYSFHLGRGEMDKAEKVVLEGVNNTPQDAVLYTMLVPLYANAGKEAKALDAVAKAHRADPAFADAYLAGLRVHAGAGRVEQALAESEAYLAVSPDSPGFLVASGALLDLLGRTAEADARFDRALASKDRQVVLVVANRAAATGRTDKARQVLEAALQADSQEDLREALAVLLVRENKPDAALALYSSIEAQRPREALIGRYRLLTHMRRNQEAAETARTLGLREGGSSLPTMLEAYALERMQQREQGIQLLDAAYRQKGSADLLLAMGGMLERGGDLARAEACYKDALKVQPDDVPTLLAMGTLQMRRKAYSKSVPVYEKALRLAPANVVAMNNLAMAYLQQNGRAQMALQLALQAYTHSPENPEVLDTLGTCMMANGRADEASRAYGRAVAAAPENPTLRYHHAEAHFKAGRKGKAAEELRVALQTPDFPEAAQARELLRKAGN
ncbi:tetratricopeptide repeat protein [Nitratidesulfovibrio sp. SRB-5]|uniref:tetratricopeptide repeat protein n=1 Tax=Nitratidesulfovibrio sp. SRB-5 TaxID=2872636 RepID=UPI0010260557|nr:tetratricopeptide repeat protein [Nitratidesulfovibrio sp. SRB-5]MBZ2172976.1 tetratricopeptide repeat protein [Nitratidesulfovibrio sp. SRB-5]RXF78489.1 tetratricopeptide repeat protein [Desulfovibrio sp. DS-1]